MDQNAGDYLYWEMRDKDKVWKVPSIFEEGCEAFYDFHGEEADAQKEYNESQFKVQGGDANGTLEQHDFFS